MEGLYQKSFIKLVDITGLLFVKGETQGQCPKNCNGNKRSWVSQGARCALYSSESIKRVKK